MTDRDVTRTLPDPVLDAAEMLAAGQRAALSLFEARLRAIGAIPGTLPQDRNAEATSAHQRADDEALEAFFDNMPV